VNWDEAKVRAALETIAREQGRSDQEISAYVESELPRLRREQAEGFPQGTAAPFRTDDDPSVFARFDFVDLVEGREWRVTGYLATDPRGALVVRRVQVQPWLPGPIDSGLLAEPTTKQREDPRGYDVTSTVLRGLHMARIRDRSARQLRELNGALAIADHVGWPTPNGEARAAITETAERATARVRGPGRRGFGDDFYRCLAEEYLALQDARECANRTSRGLISELATKLTLTPPQVRDAVATARRLGWLTAGTPGRAGAAEGQRLRAWRTKAGSPDAPTT
jgi:hypothetical protein